MRATASTTTRTLRALREPDVNDAVDEIASDDANDDANDDRGRLSAAHAAGKILITTDPRKLTDAQRLCAIRPLLWACRHVKATDLAVCCGVRGPSAMVDGV